MAIDDALSDLKPLTEKEIIKIETKIEEKSTEKYVDKWYSVGITNSKLNNLEKVNAKIEHPSYGLSGPDIPMLSFNIILDNGLAARYNLQSKYDIEQLLKRTGSTYTVI